MRMKTRVLTTKFTQCYKAPATGGKPPGAAHRFTGYSLNEIHPGLNLALVCCSRSESIRPAAHGVFSPLVQFSSGHHDV